MNFFKQKISPFVLLFIEQLDRIEDKIIKFLILKHNGPNNSQYILIIIDQIISPFFNIAKCLNIVVILHHLGEEIDEQFCIFQKLLNL